MVYTGRGYHYLSNKTKLDPDAVPMLQGLCRSVLSLPLADALGFYSKQHNKTE